MAIFVLCLTGTFKTQQLLDVLGHVADDRQHPMAMNLKVITTLMVTLSGESKAITINPKAKFNQGELSSGRNHSLCVCVCACGVCVWCVCVGGGGWEDGVWGPGEVNDQ